MPGGVSKDSLVLSVGPEGTVLGPLLFIIMISDITMMSHLWMLLVLLMTVELTPTFLIVKTCDSLQADLNSLYSWATDNNMYLILNKLSIFILAVVVVGPTLPPKNGGGVQQPFLRTLTDGIPSSS